MIHRAAGWAALRAWLLVCVAVLEGLIIILSHAKMFVVNRFLTGTEVASLLRYYESLTDMNSWYDTTA
jgi:hypothetical protein